MVQDTTTTTTAIDPFANDPRNIEAGITISFMIIGCCMACLVARSICRNACPCITGFGNVKASIKQWGRGLTIVVFLVSATAYVAGSFSDGATAPVSVYSIFGFSVAWWLLSAVWTCIVEPGHVLPVVGGESFVGHDVYMDLTQPMFSVCIHFLLQWLFFTILFFEADHALWAEREPLTGNLFARNVGVSLFVQMYLLLRMRGNAWNGIYRLRKVVAIECERGGKTLVESVPPCDVSFRLTMSIIINGILQKYLLIAYPVYLMAASDGFEIVKDAFAITLVLELDNLQRPKPFKALMEIPDGTEVAAPGQALMRPPTLEGASWPYAPAPLAFAQSVQPGMSPPQMQQMPHVQVEMQHLRYQSLEGQPRRMADADSQEPKSLVEDAGCGVPARGGAVPAHWGMAEATDDGLLSPTQAVASVDFDVATASSSQQKQVAPAQFPQGYVPPMQGAHPMQGAYGAQPRPMQPGQPGHMPGPPPQYQQGPPQQYQQGPPPQYQQGPPPQYQQGQMPQGPPPGWSGHN